MDMNDKIYQILCRNVYLCTGSALRSYKALENGTSEFITPALAASLIKYEDFDANTTKEQSLQLLLDAEKNIKELYNILNNPEIPTNLWED